MALLKVSPLDLQHRDLGAKLTEFGGWEMPLSYSSGTVTEHKACRNDAVMFDVSHLGTVRVEGDDAFALLQRTLTNDLSKIEPGRAQYTHLLDSGTAGVVDDIIVWWVAPTVFDVMPNASNTSRVIEVLGGQDVTASRAIIAIQGPQARRRIATFAPEIAGVRRFGVETVWYRDIQIEVAGTGYTGEDGVEVSIPAEHAPTLWNELSNAGILPAGLGARDTLRLEAGLPLHGHELGPSITPIEAGLSWVVGWDKPEFIGRDVLLEKKRVGVTRHLVGLQGEGRQPLRGEEHVLTSDGQDVIGMTTSGNFSPMLGCGIALAFVPPTFMLGSSLSVEVREHHVSAAVIKLPFFTTRSKGQLS